MEDITSKLQELTKSRRITKLIYKQTNQKKASVFVNDLSVK
jgi:dsRNA-specific ribonuclease